MADLKEKSVIEVDGLTKIFRIPHERRNTVFESLLGLLQKPLSYELLHALRDVSFQVKRGEAIGIIGGNGSGKTTLLKIIARILRPTEGSVAVRGRVVPFLELGVGFQGDLTATENVFLYGTILGMPRHKIAAKFDEIIEFAGLQKFVDTKLKNFSSGMQLRLAFSTAAQTDGNVFLIDEVLAVGDAEFQQKCLEVFERFRKEGRTIVLASHDMNLIKRFCDRAILLEKGKVKASGDAAEVVKRYIG